MHAWQWFVLGVHEVKVLDILMQPHLMVRKEEYLHNKIIRAAAQSV